MTDAALPKAGYLALPLIFEEGRLRTCTLEESVESWTRLNLNVPLQGTQRPRWMAVDPDVGCRVPHFEFHTVVRTLLGDVNEFRSAVRTTALKVDPRVRDVTIETRDLAPDDPARRRGDTFLQGKMKAVTIQWVLVDGSTPSMEYLVAFAGSGPVFEES